MITGLFHAARIFFESAIGSNIGFVPNDRIDLGGLGFAVEFQRPMQVAMVGERQSVHAAFFGTVDQFVNRSRAVQEAIVAVAMKMNKGLTTAFHI